MGGLGGGSGEARLVKLSLLRQLISARGLDCRVFSNFVLAKLGEWVGGWVWLILENWGLGEERSLADVSWVG